MTDIEGERFLNMIEALIRREAEARIGKRRVHVIAKDDAGRVVLAFDWRTWQDYTSSGRPTPKHARSGLR